MMAAPILNWPDLQSLRHWRMESAMICPSGKTGFVQGDFDGLDYRVHCQVLDHVDGVVRFNDGSAVLMISSTQSAVSPIS
jgi:hypothetical protein